MKVELKVDENNWEVNINGENPMQLMDQGIKQVASAIAANPEVVKDMVDKIVTISQGVASTDDRSKEQDGSTTE